MRRGSSGHQSFEWRVRLHKDLLGDHVGVIAMANDPARNAIDRGLVSFDEIGKNYLGPFP